MKRNYLSKVMSEKSDFELDEIISDKTRYTEDAIQAVTWEIERRIQSNENTINSKTIEIESNQETFQETEYIDKEEENDDENVEYVLDDLSLPELYTKNTIVLISCIFSTFFGAILLSSNLKYTENYSKWLIVLLVGFGFSIILFLALIMFGLKLYLLVGINILGSKILTEHFWNKYIGIDFKHRSKKIIFI